MKRNFVGKVFCFVMLLVLCATFGVRAARLASAPSSAGTLVPTGDMSVARSGHTATLLPNGKVLIAGGMGRNGVFYASAELYDPSTGTFTPTDNLPAKRVSHTATLLSDGRVLIAGGMKDSETILAAWETYDPATGMFSSGKKMSSARADHSAVLLANGKVLVVGGYDKWPHSLSSAELFDPASKQFVDTGSMATPRLPHFAVALKDGRVLVAGGTRARNDVIAAAEIYDPAQGAFSSVGEMTEPRHKHAAVLLPDGKVLIAGGSDNRDWRGELASAEIFDPVTLKFSAAASMSIPRFKHGEAVVLLRDGRALFAGGAKTPEIYDPRTGRWSQVSGSLDGPRYFSTATLLPDGTVLIAGGYDEGHSSAGPLSTARAWLFKP